MDFEDFLKHRENGLIKVIGENDWKDNKVYFVDEIIQFVREYRQIELDQLHLEGINGSLPDSKSDIIRKNLRLIQHFIDWMVDNKYIPNDRVMHDQMSKYINEIVGGDER